MSFFKFRKRKTEEQEMSFLGHLEVLRWHLIRCLAAIIIFSIIAFIGKNIIFDYILFAPKNSEFFTNHWFCELSKLLNINDLCINQKPTKIINIDMSGQFSTHLSISILAGIILSVPYIFWEMWKFVKPALYENEKNYAKGIVFFTSMLFNLGILFGYFIILPISIHFFANYQVSEQVENQINLTSYISTLITTIFACGLTFELPIFVYFFSKIGLLTPTFLRKYRRHSIVLILIVAAIITPPDVFSQLIVSIPLIILYEVSIFISKKVLKQKELQK